MDKSHQQKKQKNYLNETHLSGFTIILLFKKNGGFPFLISGNSHLALIC